VTDEYNRQNISETMKKLPPVHPGEVLLEDFMKPLGLSRYRVAMDIGAAPPRISQIVRGKRAVTADTALRLARYFNTSPGIWLRLQARYDLEVAKAQSGKEINRQVKVLHPAHSAER
jgi:addiction module HigA family antidote